MTPGDGVEISSRAFAVQLMRRLAGAAPVDTSGWLRDQIRAAGLDPEEITHEEHQAQAASSITMRNIFTSLRVIGDVDWGSWFEGVSLIEQELRRSPGYRALDFPTRNFYREAVEDLAGGSGKGEIDVARAALARARRSTDDLHTDVGYWLVDDGRADLASALSFRPSARQRAAEVARRTGVWGYVASQLVVNAFLSATAATLVWAAVQSGGPSMGDHRIPGLPTWAPPTWVLLVALAALLPLSDLAIAIVNRRASVIFPARPLPGLSLTGGVPEDLRTLIAVPVLLDSPETVDQLVAVLEEHHLANRDGEVYVALVTDWTDHDSQDRVDDEALLARAVAGVGRLNETYPGDRFLLFHRGRRWNAGEGVWMGWERKRGKLRRAQRVLRARRRHDLRVGRRGRLPRTSPTCMTLDADTRLPRDAVARLVGKLAHPLNRPVLRRARRRRSRGYAILQPRVTPSLPGGDAARSSSGSSRPAGHRPLRLRRSDVYQDVFGEGSFTGKGLYDVDASTRRWRAACPRTRCSATICSKALRPLGAGHRRRGGRGLPARYAVDARASIAGRAATGSCSVLHLSVRSARRPGAVALEDGRQSAALADHRRSWVAALAGWALLPFARPRMWRRCSCSPFMAPTRSCGTCCRLVAPRRGTCSAAASRGRAGRRRDSPCSAHRSAAHGSSGLADGRRHRPHALPRCSSAAATCSNGAPPRRPSTVSGSTFRLLPADVRRGDHRRGRRCSPPWRPARRAWRRRCSSRRSGPRRRPSPGWSAARPKPPTRLRVSRGPHGDAARSRGAPGAFSRPSSTAEHHLLPPDNFQETPQPVVAPPHVADQYRRLPAVGVSARDFGWISRRGGRAARSDHGDDRKPGALSRPPLQLVRHARR